MNAEELLKKVIAAGADEEGIRDRFCGNVELYEMCFREFLDEPNFVALRDAIHTRSYDRAFEAAHALKGLSGNLGVTGFYDAIRILTNSLRSGQYDSLDAEYAEAERQHDRLKRLISDAPEPEARQAALPRTEPRARFLKGRPLSRDKGDRLLVNLLCVTAIVIVAIGLLFFRINIIHDRKVLEESGQHLMEMSNQIKLYIEENIDIDWRIAQSVGDSILDSSYVDDDPAIFKMLQRKQAVWGVSDLMLYTDNGYCIYADGSAENTDIASMNVFNARKYGKSLSILDSRLIYTVPLDSPLKFQGARIVAISVVRDMSSFLDDMSFSSFGGNAWMYLTERSGILISSLRSPYTKQAFNIQAIVSDMEIKPIGSSFVAEDFFESQNTGVYLLSNASQDLYGVSTPIHTDDAPMRLFYFVPEDVVNRTMSGFSQQLVIFSMIIILMFAVCAFIASLYIYKSRKKMFDRAILTRERMFDLLVKNTKTAFGLFSVNQPQPDYVSANTAQVIGDTYWALDKSEAGYRLHNDQNVETDNILSVNEALQDWDGTQTFRSGYLCNRQSATPTYFVFELYPINDSRTDFVGIAQDVTSVYAREEAVRGAMELATQANNAKTRFLSSMSHDIRTPMNAIMNMSNFALESIDQPKKLGNYLHLIHESAEHLLHLINDVLDMSRIESGQLIMASVSFDLKEEMQRQVEIIRPLCTAKNQTLMTDFTGLSETAVSGDALKFSQIIINLLSNAVKFTPERGAVRFIAKEISSIRDDIITVCITVEDNGIGIASSEIKKIFEPFSRANDKTVNKIEGTGLGLTIVKSYVDAMGGTISCDSEHGEGTIFTVELFFPRADCSIDRHNPDAGLTKASFLGLHALVAEDNHTNQLIAKDLLERMGFILDFADDGSEAVQRFISSKPDTYDVIYMDIQMPVLDGNAATMQIRASDHPQAKTIPIIAMSANAFAEDIEKARAAGMDGYVDKPIVSFKLAEQTKKVFESKKGEGK